MKKSKMIKRNSFIDRAAHWVVAISFFLVALSGISMFFPSLKWLTETFGTPQLGRILHPFFGLLIVVALSILFVRFVKHNIPAKGDLQWWMNIIEVLKGNEHKVTRTDKYNPGQKVMFWSIMGLMIVLLVTGVIIWRPYFAHNFSIEAIRWALMIHAVAAILLIHAILMHMYLAFWVKGSIQGMIEGEVSRKWAKFHHPRWYESIVAKEEAEEKAQLAAEKQK